MEDKENQPMWEYLFYSDVRAMDEILTIIPPEELGLLPTDKQEN